jgi:hypothetical protein
MGKHPPIWYEARYIEAFLKHLKFLNYETIILLF